MTTRDKGWYWHIHHMSLVERAREPIEERRAHIREYKPEEEKATRLRLLRRVKDQAGVTRAVNAMEGRYVSIDRAREKALAAVNGLYHECAKDAPNHLTHFAMDLVGRKSAARHEVHRLADLGISRLRQERYKALEAIHAKECPGCPWDGKTIFPGKGR